MAVKPAITWIGTQNFGYPDGSHGQNQKMAIVYHIAQGSLGGIDAWFNNPSSYASSHFAIGLNGAIHQYVNVDDAAWANGVMNRPDTSIPWLRECVEQGINPNLRTISIEHEGFTGNAWPEAQYRACEALSIWLIDTYNVRHGLVIPDQHFIGHYRIDSVNRASCPGSAWPRSRLFERFGRLVDVYVPRNRTIYDAALFNVPTQGVAYMMQVDVRNYGYPAEATAVDLLLGCRSRADTSYAAAYDGTVESVAGIAVYPTAPLRRDWNFVRGRVQLNSSKFLLKVRPLDQPVDVTAILKGYFALE